nr:ferritin-like domain-containing protein [Micromonospora sp. DSM 115978]
AAEGTTLLVSTQVMDEARHAEVFSRFLDEKIGLTYPINPHLQALLGDALNDSRWDMPYLGMQVLIEGLALAAFGILRDRTDKPLPKQILSYVMQDEARHVAFGRLALRDYYAQLTEAEPGRDLHPTVVTGLAGGISGAAPRLGRSTCRHRGSLRSAECCLISGARQTLGQTSH